MTGCLANHGIVDDEMGRRQRTAKSLLSPSGDWPW